MYLYYIYIDEYWFEKGMFKTTYENELSRYLTDKGVTNFRQTKTYFTIERLF